jgi:hypothetical protein
MLSVFKMTKINCRTIIFAVIIPSLMLSFGCAGEIQTTISESKESKSKESSDFELGATCGLELAANGTWHEIRSLCDKKASLGDCQTYAGKIYKPGDVIASTFVGECRMIGSTVPVKLDAKKSREEITIGQKVIGSYVASKLGEACVDITANCLNVLVKAPMGPVEEIFEIGQIIVDHSQPKSTNCFCQAAIKHREQVIKKSSLLMCNYGEVKVLQKCSNQASCQSVEIASFNEECEWRDGQHVNYLLTGTDGLPCSEVDKSYCTDKCASDQACVGCKTQNTTWFGSTKYYCSDKIDRHGKVISPIEQACNEHCQGSSDINGNNRWEPHSPPIMLRRQCEGMMASTTHRKRHLPDGAPLGNETQCLFKVETKNGQRNLP